MSTGLSGASVADVRALNPALADFYEVHLRERQKAAEETRTSVRVCVGNRVQQSGEEQYDWTIFVEDLDDCVQNVRFQLHPTFNPSEVLVSAPPFELKRRGWGTFQVQVLVTDRRNTVHPLTHQLCFDGPSSRVHTLVLPAAPSPAIKRPRMTGVSERGMHGSLGVGAGFGAPLVLTVCDQEARPGYATMQAHEYQEDPSTFRKKIQCLGELIRRSQHFVAYTGAGISTASGIDDYASQSKQSVATGERAKGRVKRKTGLDAEPTFAHFTLAALYKAGRLKHWVQQNHDGLPQKAGFPQQHINEIHGAWFDPSNPVVPMDGSLRSDLCAWMEEEEQKADLVLAMGSSLCGMNADRMVDTPNRKAARGKALGAVIVGYQRTQMDESCALRIFANIDETMLALALELSLPMSLQPYRQNIPETARVPGRPHAFSIPYATTDGKGYKQDGKKQILDLRPGARLILTGGPGVGFRGVVRRVPDKKQSTYSVQFPSTREGPGLGKSLQLYALGAWMIEAACKGTLAQLPVTNDPTPPPPLCDISESFDNINQLPSLLVLMENSSKKTKDAITAMLHDLAQAERKLPEAKRRVQCFFTACGGGPAAEIRRGCKLPPCPPRAHSHPLRAAQGSSWRCDGCQCDGAGKPRFRCAPCDFDHCGDCKALVENTASEGTQSPMMVILNMPQNGAFFRPSVNLSTVTSTNVGLFLDAFKLGSLTRQQFGG